MDINKESQKAGDNSTQIQAQSITIIQGIDEKRAREIFNEMYLVARKDLTQEAYELAQERVLKLETTLIPKMEKIDGALNAFADPGFQLLLTEAHKAAAASEYEVDIDILSELLVRRVERGDNRKTKAGISKAVEIVDKVDSEALDALTLAYVIMMLSPISGKIKEGLNVLEQLIGSILAEKLPEGYEWVEHLDILDAVRVSTITSIPKFCDLYSRKLEGYVAGIPKDSDEYARCLQKLAECGLPHDVLVESELDSNYARILVVNKEAIKNILLSRFFVQDGIQSERVIRLSEHQISVLEEIYELTTSNNTIKDKLLKSFRDEIGKKPCLSRAQVWWDSIPHGFNLTSVGRVLAHANAKRINPGIPDME